MGKTDKKRKWIFLDTTLLMASLGILMAINTLLYIFSGSNNCVFTIVNLLCWIIQFAAPIVEFSQLKYFFLKGENPNEHIKEVQQNPIKVFGIVFLPIMLLINASYDYHYAVYQLVIIVLFGVFSLWLYIKADEKKKRVGSISAILMIVCYISCIAYPLISNVISSNVKFAFIF